MLTKILTGMTVILSVDSFVTSMSIKVLCLHLLKNGMSKPTKQDLKKQLTLIRKLLIIRQNIIIF